MLEWTQNGFHHTAHFHGYTLTVFSASVTRWALVGEGRRLAGGEMSYDDALDYAKQSAQRSLENRLEYILDKLRCPDKATWEAMNG